MAKLVVQKMNILPVGSIKPAGWLDSQIRLANDLQKRLGGTDGLLTDGTWTKGEVFPRYVRGLILLAGVTGDRVLLEKAESYISPIFASANEGGNFGPEGKFISPKIEAVKAVLSYYELTGDERALNFLRKFFKSQFNTFSVTPCWYQSRARLLEEIPAIDAVFKETDSEWLHDLGEKLRDASNDWFKLAVKFRYKRSSGRYLNTLSLKKLRKKVEEYENSASGKPLTVDKANAEWKKKAHQIAVETSGVSIAKAIKYPCTYGRFIGDAELKNLSLKMISALEKFHGNATGAFSADFRLAGTSPTRGIDVESAVETVESLVEVLAETGDFSVADLIEKIIFNLIPASAFDDVRAVQDITVPNQLEASVEMKERLKECEYGNAYFGGLLSRGAIAFISAYPLFVKSVCMTRDRELNFLSYAPCMIDTVVSGSRIRIKEDTSYPFRNTIVFKVEEAEGDPEIKINFRVPSHTTMQLISGGQVVASGDDVISVKCVLKTGSTFMLKLDIPLSVLENKDGTLSMYKGNVLLASKIASETRVSVDRHIYYANFAKRWNFAPVVAKRSTDGVRRLYDDEQTFVNDIGAIPYDHDKPPFEIRVRCKNVANWDFDVSGTCAIPRKPSFSEESIERTFVPFGCTTVRICHFPPCYKG